MSNVYLPEGLRLGSPQNSEYISSAEGLRRAMQQDKIIEAPAAMCDCDMNLYVDLGTVRGVIPREEVALVRPGEEIKQIAVITRVGKPVCFKVLSVGEERGMTTAVLSRRLAQIECKRRFVDDLIPGDIVKAKVTHMEPFGAFVDIGCGIVSLMSIDSISVSRIAHPSDRFYNGQEIYAVIKTVDRENDRIFVSHRELLGTWEENAALFSPMQTVSGIVRSIEDYGIFVELAPNLAGLAEFKSGVSVGDIACVYIKSMIPARMKIKLVLIDASRPGGGGPPPPRYFVDPRATAHLDRWLYSPAECAKVIETVFAPQ
ncbi:MAG: 30S ribosomal protein S1 [Clostridia bacterium]|nr:30S ribosomal protein S1 [Clostridia bacterium]